MIYRFNLKKNDLFILAAVFFFSLSYSTSPFSFFIYFAFIPFLRILEISKNHKDSFRKGYIIGLLINAIVFYWLSYFKFSSYFLIVILNPLQFAFFGFFYSHLKVFSPRIRLLVFPVLWTFLEFAREFGDLAFNWINIGYTQGNFIKLIQFVDISGISGVVLWICFINVFIYNSIYKVLKFKNSSVNFIMLILMFVFPLIYGHLKISDNKISNGIVASYIQPNVTSKHKWDSKFFLNTFHDLVKESELLEPQAKSILIWPETAISKPIQEIDDKSKIFNVIGKNNVNLLTGTVFEDTSNAEFSRFNSAILIEDTEQQNQIYHKIKLVPMEEYLPFNQLYRFLIPEKYLKYYYNKGIEKTVFTASMKIYESEYKSSAWEIIGTSKQIEPVKFSSIICIESSLPGFVHDFIKNGAQFLIVITNDEWFGYSAQSVQHLITSRFRSIENRRSIVHCSNSGISSFIDFYGRYYGKSELLKKSNSTQIVPLNKDVTIYTLFGDWISIFCSIFILITFILIFYKTKVKKGL